MPPILFVPYPVIIVTDALSSVDDSYVFENEKHMKFQNV